MAAVIVLTVVFALLSVLSSVAIAAAIFATGMTVALMVVRFLRTAFA